MELKSYTLYRIVEQYVTVFAVDEEDALKQAEFRGRDLDPEQSFGSSQSFPSDWKVDSTSG